MNFNFNVKSNKSYSFNPTNLEIYIGAKSLDTDGIEVVAVQTVLTETINNGKLVETKEHIFPVSMLQPAIKEYKLGDSKPEVDISKLSDILLPFGLELTDSN